MPKKIISFVIILLLCLQFIAPLKLSAYEFDPNYIISDYEYVDYDCMNLAEIQAFLEQKGSFLATYKTKDVDGKMKTAAEIIYRAANDYKISPKFLLVLLQKEQSLIETQEPTQYQLDWATGFARCDDPVACSPEAVAEYKGFAIQVEKAAWRNRFYIENSHKEWLKKANTTYEIDGYNITPINLATANLYNYTPHYHGNYNFWTIWNRYFSKNYPDGTLLQVEGSDIVYLIDYGTRRPFANKAAFSSRGYDSNKIISVSPNDLLKYEEGGAIKFPNYTLMRSPVKTIYLLINDRKYKIVSPEVFKKLGFTSDEIVDLSNEEIESFADGTPLTMEGVYPLGALLRDKLTGGVFYVENGIKNPIWDKAILKSNYPKEKIINEEHEELEKLKNGWPIKFKDGELLKAKQGTSVYVISNGERRPILSGQIYEDLGFKWENIIEIDEKILNALHPLGEPIDIGEEKEELKEGTLVKLADKTSVYLIDSKLLRPILSGEVFEKLGFKWEDIKNISEKTFNLYTLGEAVGPDYNKNAQLAKALNDN